MKHKFPKDLSEEELFQTLFQVPMSQFNDLRLVEAFGGPFYLDLIKFDEYAHENWGYKEETHGSLKSFLLSRFGKDAVKLIEKLIWRK